MTEKGLADPAIPPGIAGGRVEQDIHIAFVRHTCFADLPAQFNFGFYEIDLPDQVYFLPSLGHQIIGVGVGDEERSTVDEDANDASGVRVDGGLLPLPNGELRMLWIRLFRSRLNHHKLDATIMQVKSKLRNQPGFPRKFERICLV